MELSNFTIAVTNMTAMVGFYNAVFDAQLTAIPNSPFFKGRIAGMSLLFCPNEITEINAEKNRIQMGFIVHDVEAVVRKAQIYGGEAYGERHETEERRAWGICDPDGNSIEIQQVKS